ncbi:MAG: DUF2079 domain-containing protein [Candidatus Alcyoniella australis]|nr:DUF2079 domain-containing protein [Candidatus Alcyoniella australis]
MDSKTNLTHKSRCSFALICVFSCIFAAVYSLLQAAKLNAYGVQSFDVVNFNMIWTEFLESRQGTVPFLSSLTIVMQPAAAFIFLFEAIHPSSWWPILVNVLFLAAAMPIFYLLCRQVLEGYLWPWLLTVSFAAHPLTGYLALSGYHYAPQLIFFLLLEILFLQHRKRRLFSAALVLGCTSRVNGPLINLLLGIALWISGDRTYGRRAILISLAWIAILLPIVLLLDRHLGNELDSELLHLNAYGGTVGQALVNILTKPQLLYDNLFIRENALHLLEFLPVLFLPFLAPLYLFPAAVEAAYIMFSMSSNLQVQWYDNYRAVIGERFHFHNDMTVVLPLIYISALFGLRKLRDRLNNKAALLWVLVVVFVVVNAANHYWHSTLLSGPAPLSREFNLNYYTKTDHGRIIDRAWEMIPQGSRVKGMENLAGFHGPRMERYYHFYFLPADQRFDYLLFDMYSFITMAPRQTLFQQLEGYLKSDEFGTIFFEDGVVLMRRGARVEGNQAVLDFIEQHAKLLEQNLLNPYLFGASPLTIDSRPAVYSQTQLVAHGDDRRVRDAE